MTTAELRVLYLLKKAGGRAKRGELVAQMHRLSRDERDQAFNNLEAYHLIERSKVEPEPGRGGTGAIQYALTDPGREHVDYLTDEGVLKAPRA